MEIVTSQGTFSADAAGPGGAPAVLLLHGFPQSRHTWRSTLPRLAGAGYRAVAVDQRGYSVGVRPAGVAAYATDRLVADVAVPVLYLWDDADQTVGRVAAELTAEHVTGPYRFVVIPGGGHFLTDDGSDETVERELLAHLQRAG